MLPPSPLNQSDKEAWLQDVERELVACYGEGLRLLPAEQVAESLTIRRIREALRTMSKTITLFEDLMATTNLPEEDKRMLNRLTNNTEWTFDSYLGACLRMRSLSDGVKNRLLSEFQSE